MLKNQKGAMWLGVLFGLVIGLAFAVGVAWYLMKSTPKVFKNEDTTARKYDESDRKSNDNNKSSNQASKTTGAVIKPVRPSQQANNKSSNANSSDVAQAQPVKPQGNDLDKSKRANVQNNTQTKVLPAPEKSTHSQKEPNVVDQNKVNKPKFEAEKSQDLNKESPVATAQKTPVKAATPAKEDEKKVESHVVATETKADTKKHLFLQLGAFKNKQDAQKLLDRLSRAGITDAQILDAGKDGLFRVKNGPYETKDAARQAKGKLALAGFESIYSR
jgi:cell division protein FtsN